MPIPGSRLVKLTREVSVSKILEKVEQMPRLVLIGTAEERARLRELLLGGSTDVIDASVLSGALMELDPIAEGGAIPEPLAAQAIFTYAPWDKALLRLKIPLFQVTDEETLQAAAERLTELQEDWVLSLGRHVPAFRAVMADQVVRSTSLANAQIAIISSLPGVSPLAALLLPAAAADIFILTKNQAMMVLKLAAMFGKPMQISARLAELAPVVGSAFGWRALAREVVGLVPGGVGVVAKGSIAYAGTFTVGKAAYLFYARGRHVTAEEKRGIYREALERGRGAVASLLARLRRKPDEEEQPRSNEQAEEAAESPERAGESEKEDAA